MFSPGDLVEGDFKILRAFTNGGMGVVYHVHHLSWNMEMGLKQPQEDLFKDDQARALFIKECSTWMDMGVHPNIVSCYFIKKVFGTPSVFMEYADGGSLADLLRSGRLYSSSPDIALKRILDIAIQIARGLKYAHEKGYIHQDVKPANVLLTKRGDVKVSDFGLSKASISFSGFTTGQYDPCNPHRSMLASSGGCTPAYCSPEQFTGQSLTRRTDIWSWALVVLEMIHGNVFWRLGANASKMVARLGVENVFSSNVKNEYRLVALLQECLNEQENFRPHSFDLIEARMLSIYEPQFGSYPRREPDRVLLSAGTLCNRIASYSELSDPDVGELRIYQAYADLQKNVRWSAWGEINYAIHWLKGGGQRVSEIVRKLANLLRRDISDEDKKWIVEMLLLVGKTSPMLPVFRTASLGDKLKNRITKKHRELRDQLASLFANGSQNRQPFESKEFLFFDANSEDEPPRDNDGNYYLGTAVSQNATCRVSVSIAPYSINDEHNSDQHLVISVFIGKEVFTCQDTIPTHTNIRFITTDDCAKMISLWLGERSPFVFCRKVLRRIGNRIVPYITDYRGNGKWGNLSHIFQSGDAKRLLTIDTQGRCSVWINDKADSRTDGRNVCEVDLSDYGLIPPDDMLPNLQLEQGFEYDIDDVMGYRLMDFLTGLFGAVKYPFRIFTPNSPDAESLLSIQGHQFLEEADNANKLGLFGDAAALLTAAIQAGIPITEERMGWRHRYVMSGRRAFIRDMWLFEQKREDWVVKEALFPSDGKPAYEAFFKWSAIRICRDTENKSPCAMTILFPLPNGDVLACPMDKSGWHAKGIGRYHVFDQYPHCNDLAKIWEFSFGKPEPTYGCFKWNTNVVTDERKVTLFLPSENIQKISIDLDFGTVISTETYQGDPPDIRNESSRKAIRNVGWALLLEDKQSTKRDILVENSDPSCMFWVQSWCLSPDDSAVAIITWKHRLVIYCVNDHRIAFEYDLPSGVYQDMCFDTTGRWLSILYDTHHVLTFQILWDYMPANNDALKYLTQ